MIGSVFEQRDQLAELERRRQEIAGQSAAQQTAVPVPMAVTTGVMPAAALGAAPTALKSAEPDVTKRRKGKDRADRKDRAPAADEVATGAVDQGRGYRDAMADEASCKTYSERGSEAGPGRSMQPGPVDAERFDRPYLEAGHAAESPVAGPPRTNPVPMPYGRGVPVPIALPGASAVGYVPAHVAASYSMGSPSER